MSNYTPLQRGGVFQEPVVEGQRTVAWGVSRATTRRVRKPNIPLPFSSFKETLDRGANRSISTLDERLPRSRNLPFGASALSLPPWARNTSRPSPWLNGIIFIAVFWKFSNIIFIGIGHDRNNCLEFGGLGTRRLTGAGAWSELGSIDRLVQAPPELSRTNQHCSSLQFLASEALGGTISTHISCL